MIREPGDYASLLLDMLCPSQYLLPRNGSPGSMTMKFRERVSSNPWWAKDRDIPSDASVIRPVLTI